MALISFTCSACGETVEHDPARGHVPPEWRMLRIEKTVVLLCATHSHPGWFREGVSPVLLQMLRARGVDVDRG